MRCVLLEQLAGFKSYFSVPVDQFLDRRLLCRMHWFQLKAAATTLGRFPPSPGFPEASPVKEISARVCLFLVFAVLHIRQFHDQPNMQCGNARSLAFFGNGCTKVFTTQN